MSHVLEIQSLSKQYGKLKAVKNLSFTVEKGNVYGLLGPNGSGKSTTLGMILNVVNPTTGSWKWFGEKPSSKSLKKIGAIIEKPNFYPYLSAYNNLAIVAKIKDTPTSNINQKLELVGLLNRKNDKFKTFSLGMKQRLAIASALLNNPEVLILDEPTNGLDPQGIIQIREIIQNIAQQGTTIILASHLLDEVEKICSHVVVLNQGTALYSGAVAAMTNSFGYLKLQSQNNDQLLGFLERQNYTQDIQQAGGYVLAYLNQEVKTEDINQQLFNNQIVLSHLEIKQESLEQKFLQITKN